VRVLDGGTDDGLSYVVMERLRGRTLRELIDSPPVRLDLATKIDLVAQLCVGLHFAHEHGLVHGNVTPENVFVTDENVVKILNLGGVSSTDRTIISDNALPGSLHYTAPEEVGGGEVVDGRSDLFSVGVILYELLTGHPPTDRPPTAVSLESLQREGSVPLEELTALETALRRALEEDPSKRFASAQQLAYALWKVQLPHRDLERDADDVDAPGETLYVEGGQDTAQRPTSEVEGEQTAVSARPLIYASIAAVIMVAVATSLFSC
jgi:serine/threonine-protein kinase